jgi:hypothetical protein
MWVFRVNLLLFLVAALVASPRARAQQRNYYQTIHPIFSAVPGLPGADDAHRLFSAAVARYKLGPVEVMDVPGAPAPRAPELLRKGRAAVEGKRFAEAETSLDNAVAEVMTTGAAGLTTAELADLFLLQAMAAQQADWRDLPGPLTEITPNKAKQAYLRAAVLAPDRVLLPRQFPPIAIESWRLATTEIKQRPRGSLVVRAPSSALVSVDAGPLKPASDFSSRDLFFGDHWIRVEDPGRRLWAAMVPLSESSFEVDVPPLPALTLDDASAAAHARRQAAAFALVAELQPGAPAIVQLRLVEARSGARRNATALPFPGDLAALDAAIMRLDQEARRARFAEERGTPVEPTSFRQIAVAPVPATPADQRPRVQDDPGLWARARWPLLTAVGVAVGTAAVLGLVVANDRGR